MRKGSLTNLCSASSPVLMQIATPRNDNWSNVYQNYIEKRDSCNDELVGLISTEFMKWFKRANIDIDREIFESFLTYIAGRYNVVFYHSFTHASHVVLNCIHLLKTINVDVDPFLCISFLVAALIHDVGHEGVTNVFLVKESHPAAITFNDQSVAEMNSLKIFFDSLSEYNFFVNMDSATFQRFRSLVIELVLCTDIADADRRIVAEQKFILASKDENGNLVSNSTNIFVLLTICIRLADVGATTQDFETLKVWSNRLFVEGRIAHRNGRGIFVSSEDFDRNQIGFLVGYVEKLFQKLESTRWMSTTLVDEMQRNITRNVNLWKEHGKDILARWEEDLSSIFSSYSPDRL